MQGPPTAGVCLTAKVWSFMVGAARPKLARARRETEEESENFIFKLWEETLNGALELFPCERWERRRWVRSEEERRKERSKGLLYLWLGFKSPCSSSRVSLLGHDVAVHHAILPNTGISGLDWPNRGYYKPPLECPFKRHNPHTYWLPEGSGVLQLYINFCRTRCYIQLHLGTQGRTTLVGTVNAFSHQSEYIPCG